MRFAIMCICQINNPENMIFDISLKLPPVGETLVDIVVSLSRLSLLPPF